jgi:hypothetical protein
MALVVAGLIVALVLSLCSGRSNKDVAEDTARSFVAAINEHDTDTAESIACGGITDKVKELSDTVHDAHAQLTIAQLRMTAKDREQAVLRSSVSKPATGASAVALTDHLVISVELHHGLWLVCSLE